MSNCPAIRSLPEWLVDLQGLQELLLRYCKGLTSLPERLGEIHSLRTLDVFGCRVLKPTLDLGTALDGLLAHNMPHELRMRTYQRPAAQET